MAGWLPYLLYSCATIGCVPFCSGFSSCSTCSLSSGILFRGSPGYIECKCLEAQGTGERQERCVSDGERLQRVLGEGGGLPYERANHAQFNHEGARHCNCKQRVGEQKQEYE